MATTLPDTKLCFRLRNQNQAESTDRGESISPSVSLAGLATISNESAIWADLAEKLPYRQADKVACTSAEYLKRSEVNSDADALSGRGGHGFRFLADNQFLPAG